MGRELVKPVRVDCLLFRTGGVGFDINCGVRLLRTNLYEKDVAPKREQLAQVRILAPWHGADRERGL